LRPGDSKINASTAPLALGGQFHVFHYWFNSFFFAANFAGISAAVSEKPTPPLPPSSWGHNFYYAFSVIFSIGQFNPLRLRKYCIDL
jgi:hypothetical protein